MYVILFLNFFMFTVKFNYVFLIMLISFIRNPSSSSNFDMGLPGVPKIPDRKRPSKVYISIMENPYFYIFIFLLLFNI